ncbi:hypothetical protein TELCIR_17148 [Teladorsagia circumcincta]|uniref:Uncharacterized protein n=1 Tax=Teladorsagia circumcincta TaxID=45464 RepID=A0A2G9TVR6_TELCI|nr:hypothetical protein TELCIR_17148 [Teladorsagia circumcincta]
MKRLLFVLAAVKFTMACQPVPKPSNVGKGNSTAKIQLITDVGYDVGKIEEYMGYFPKTKIKEYSAELGDFANLNSSDAGGHFAFSFMLYNCDCGKVDQWLQQIVASSEHYQKYNLVCPYPPSTPKPIVEIQKEIIIEKPPTTKAPSPLKVIYLEPPPPEYIYVTPPPQARPVTLQVIEEGQLELPKKSDV